MKTTCLIGGMSWESSIPECVSKPEALADGRVRLYERWRWTSWDQSEGECIVEEIGD
jgi:hypothetical protein